MRTAHLNALRALEATLRRGSLRAAAEELGVTPAAVGQQVRTLEEYLGRPLLNRHPRGAVPAEAARLAAPRLTSAFREIAGVLQELSAQAPENRVAVSMTHAVAETWLPSVLPAFFAQEREVDLRLDTSSAVVDLTDGAFDFAIRHMGSPGDDLDSVPLFPCHLAPACTPDFAARYGLGPGTRSLGGVPLAYFETPTRDPDWVEWEGWCTVFGIEPGAQDRGPRVSAETSGPRLAGAGLALVLVALFEVQDALREGRLVLPFGPARIVTPSYWYRLIWLKSRRLTPVQRRFRDWLDERARAHNAAMDSWLAGAATRG